MVVEAKAFSSEAVVDIDADKDYSNQQTNQTDGVRYCVTKGQEDIISIISISLAHHFFLTKQLLFL